MLCCFILKRLKISSKIFSSFKYSTDRVNTKWINLQSKIVLKTFTLVEKKNIYIFQTNL